MSKVKIRDLVVILPGIMGSVLEKDDRDLWEISGQSIWDAVTSWGSSLHGLALQQDDWEVDDLGDGIKATRVMENFHLVPGLIKVVDGYTHLRQLFRESFEVTPGTLDGKKEANYFEFPYDWRRDNRAAARQLKTLIDKKLPEWREKSGAKDAKVLLIAHSMGGLIARYYLENLEGENWRNCKALITFGTPYRGSIKALKSLSHPYKNLFLDLTTVIRSFNSLYQLLPIYEVLKDGSNYKRVKDAESIPGVNKECAIKGDAFHREIETAVEANRKNAAYHEQGYKIIPIVGSRQPTYQSAELTNGKLTVSHATPDIVSDFLWDGDGTVPRASATPLELSDEYSETFFAEQHGALQGNTQVLEQLYERIKQMQVTSLAAVREPEPAPKAQEHPALGLEVDDWYSQGEPVEIIAKLVNAEYYQSPIIVDVKSMTTDLKDVRLQLKQTKSEGGISTWRGTLEDLSPGTYHLNLRGKTLGPLDPPPVQDIFEVGANTID
ncbi:MAG: hypothetical protein MRJ96_06905 [Nitrospirales bacterium]|nr:hypothetical protein [Nitrospirales bacterium]